MHHKYFSGPKPRQNSSRGHQTRQGGSAHIGPILSPILQLKKTKAVVWTSWGIAWLMANGDTPPSPVAS